jgi:hypothetical protein
MTAYPPGTVVRIRSSASSVLAGSLWGVSLGVVREAAEAQAGVPEPAYRVTGFVGGVLTEDAAWAQGSHESVEIVVGAIDLEKAWVFEADEFLRSLRRLRPDLYLAATVAREVTQRCWSCGTSYLLRYRTHRQMPSLAREFECPGCRVSLKEVAAFVEGPEAGRIGGS